MAKKIRVPAPYKTICGIKKCSRRSVVRVAKTDERFCGLHWTESDYYKKPAPKKRVVKPTAKRKRIKK